MNRQLCRIILSLIMLSAVVFTMASSSPLQRTMAVPPQVPYSPFGVQIHYTTLASNVPGSGGHWAAAFDRAQAANTSFIRYHIGWDELQPEEAGPLNATLLISIEHDLKDMEQQGIRPIMEIWGAPQWARAAASTQPCERILTEKLDNFGDFLGEMVTRFYTYTSYWEIGNEPDMAAPAPARGMGCWGNPEEEFFGGKYYATVLRHVYQDVKSADPTGKAKVVIGGLVNGCGTGGNDPCAPPANAPAGLSKPEDYFEGILAGGGGPYFDILAYHDYAYWWSDDPLNLRSPTDWNTNALGSVGLIEKANFFRKLMAAYAISKPIMMNEGGLICKKWVLETPTTRAHSETCDGGSPGDGSEFRDDQANYMVRLLTRGLSINLHAIIWYTLDFAGYDYSQLLKVPSSGTARGYKAYYVYKYMADPVNGLAGAAPCGQLSAGVLEGYCFRKYVDGVAHTYQVYWRNDSKGVSTVALPTGFRGAIDIANPVIRIDTQGTSDTSDDTEQVTFNAPTIVRTASGSAYVEVSFAKPIIIDLVDTTP